MRREKRTRLGNPFPRRHSRILHVNPTVHPSKPEPVKSNITAYEYDPLNLNIHKPATVQDCVKLKDSVSNLWINVEGIRQDDISKLSAAFGIHPLLAEDIMSQGQRSKMDEMDDLLYVLMYMLYYNAETKMLEAEQISIVLGKKFVITFQEDSRRDFLKVVEERLNNPGGKIRQNAPDYLFYSLVDLVVDNYFVIMERLGENIEDLEEEIIQRANTVTLGSINSLRKEMIFLKRNITPVRELVGSIMRSDTDLIEVRTGKYFKDVYDHIVQASELSENYRDMMLNLHDLYLSELNLKMNEVMKVMAIVTCLLAPATVIGGIFGMNFSSMPWLHNHFGFWMAVGVMLLIPVWMMWIFKRRGWF
ncbi:MAG: magnesium/cobalt transporter CorA [Chitinophagaceae bacterium]|nr:magnesium/cobalt transporter CorA [Chitinophagaceae bacterium]